MRAARIGSTCGTEAQAHFKVRWVGEIVRSVTLLTLGTWTSFISIGPVFSQGQPADNLTPQQRREAYEREHTLELLRNQTDDAGKRILAPSDPDLVTARINSELEQLQMKHAQALSDMRNSRYLVPDDDTGVMKTVSRYNPVEISSKEQDYKREEQDYVTMRQRQESSALRYAQSRAADLQADADNLASQLNETKSKQSFRLSPVGTNMYVRNFETVGSEPQEERATVSPTVQTSSVHSQTGTANKAIIPPGWNPLEEPGRKLARHPASARQNALNKSTLHQNNVKGKSLN